MIDTAVSLVVLDVLRPPRRAPTQTKTYFSIFPETSTGLHQPVGLSHGLQGYAPLDDEEVGFRVWLVSPKFQKGGQHLLPPRRAGSETTESAKRQKRSEAIYLL